MSASESSKPTNTPIEPHIHFRDEQSTEQRERSLTNASSIDEFESKFDSMATKLKQISSNSSTILSNIDKVTTTSTTSINNISFKLNSLLSELSTIKTELSDKNIIQPKPSTKLMSSNSLNSHNNIESNTYPYTRSYLHTLSKSDLIEIITNESHELSNHNHRIEHSYRNTNHKSDKNKMKKRARSDVLMIKKHRKQKHPHEKTIKGIKGTERVATNYELIEKQRVAIKALKQKRKHNKYSDHSEMLNDHNLFMDPHEKTVTGRKATERMATNYKFIQQQRTKIKALKEERKLEKNKCKNSIQRRRMKAQKRMLGLFNHAHETKYIPNPIRPKKNNKKKHSKRRKHSILVLKRRPTTIGKNINTNKVRVLRDDEVLRFSQEIPIENFMNALNNGFVKIMDEEEQNEQYMNVVKSAKNILTAQDLCNYQYVVETKHNYNHWMEDSTDSDSDWDEYDDDDDENDNDDENEQFEFDENELEKELLLLNLKTLKKKCKEKRLSTQGGKSELIQKIIDKMKEGKHIND